MITRRTMIASGAITVAVAALPASLLASPAAPLVADMFYTEDEPWAAFVRAHVSKDKFDEAVLRMLEADSDHRENGEDWLFEYHYEGDDEEERIRIITADPEYMYMRIDSVDELLGERYRFCKATDPQAIPITVVRY